MGQNSKPRKRRISVRNSFMAALGGTVAAGALFSGLGHGTANADTGDISILGQSAVSASSSQDGAWNNMLQSEGAARRIPALRQSEDAYMEKFNQCAGMPLRQKVNCVNNILNVDDPSTGNQRIQYSGYFSGYTAPAETIRNQTGDSSAVTPVAAKALVQEGVPPDKVIVADVVDRGVPYSVVVVDQTYAMSNFPTVVPASSGNIKQWIVGHGDTAKLQVTAARDMAGHYWTAKTPPKLS